MNMEEIVKVVEQAAVANKLSLAKQRKESCTLSYEEVSTVVDMLILLVQEIKNIQ